MLKRGKFNFLGTVSFMGAVLILLGLAWIVASNWHSMPSFFKIIILISSTLAALVFGEILKNNGREFTGRSLLFLGGGFYVLSVFLISQIFFTQSSLQGTVNLILLCWPVLFLIAYFLDSIENLIGGFIVFGVWIIFQYAVLVDGDDVMFTMILLFVFLGMLLYGLKQLHKTYNHRFYKVYNFWTAFYILLGTFLLTFQIILSEWIIRPSGSLGIFNPFFLFVAAGSTIFFISSMVFCIGKNPEERKEIFYFIIIIFIVLLSISLVRLSGNIGSSDDSSEGYCYEDFSVDSCSRIYDLNSCNSNSECTWATAGNGNCELNYSNNVNNKPSEICSNINGVEVCVKFSCRGFNQNHSECEVMDEYGCYWRELGTCRNTDQVLKAANSCRDFDSKNSCEESGCIWRERFNYKTWLNPFSYTLWLLYNVFFIALIILLIGHGKKTNQPKIVNMAFVFFVAEIFSRYVGFMIDLSGYLGFSILLILGGIVLIAGAYLIQKYWKHEIKEMGVEHSHEEKQTNQVNPPH